MAESQRSDNVSGNENWERVRAVLDNPELGPGEFTDHEWATAGERMEALREKIRANPRAAAAETETLAEITRRV